MEPKNNCVILVNKHIDEGGVTTTLLVLSILSWRKIQREDDLRGENLLKAPVNQSRNNLREAE